MTTKAPANVTNIDDAATVRWLATTLERARTDVSATPSGEAVGRIRARVMGAEAPRKEERSIAA